MFSSIVVGILGLYYCSLESNASYLGRPHLYGPDEALHGSIVEFRCMVNPYPAEPILFQVFKQGDRNTTLAVYTSLDGSAASFSMVVTADTHEGTLECVVSVQNNSQIRPAVSPPHPLRVVEPVKGVTLGVFPDAEIFEGTKLILSCDVAYGNHVSYSWLLEDQPLPASAFHRHQPSLVINSTTPQHSGRYLCVATNQLNDTMIFTEASLHHVLITVKELVSSPVISYGVYHERSETSARVTCNSSRGTPPITFSLYDNASTPIDNVIVEELYTTFIVPLVPHRHLDRLYCHAKNGGRAELSDWMLLHVESVGGPVTLRYEYSTGEHFSVTDVRFYCQAAKGTHPHFQWFLNGTLLEPDTGSFYVVLHQPVESVLLLPVDSRSRGTYHCQVSDLFDNTTVVRSEKMFLDKEVLNRLPDAVVAVVFSCLGLLLTCVLTCCAAGVIFGRSQDSIQSLQEIKMESMVLEDDLDSKEYRENVDVLQAARMQDSDLGSMASTDEWTETDKATQL